MNLSDPVPQTGLPKCTECWLDKLVQVGQKIRGNGGTINLVGLFQIGKAGTRRLDEGGGLMSS